jgi:hypothetical protein
MKNPPKRICEYCGIEYSNIYTTTGKYKSEYTIPTRFCSKKCALEVNSGCIIPLIDRSTLEQKCLDFISSQGRYCTGSEIRRASGSSSKTFIKLGIKTSELNALSGFEKPFSVFQTRVGDILRNYFDPVLEEYRFRELCGRNNVPLRFDFYLPNESIVVEADGEYHIDPDHYWSVNCVSSIVDRDNKKEEFCIKNNLRLIRIPYSRIVNPAIVMSYFR